MDRMMKRPAPMPARAASAPMPRRAPLVMPEDMDDQPPMAQIEEAKRRRDMEAAYERSRGAKKFAKGGVTRGDGCVSKGHTKGKQIKMAMGGKAC
jgi:hypothetical protein